MKYLRITCAVLTLASSAAAFALVSAPPAGAVCKAIWAFREGRWLGPTCTGEGAYKNYKKVNTNPGTVNGSWECREVEAGETEGWWTTESCSQHVASGNKWVWTLIYTGLAEVLSSTEQKEWTGSMTEPVIESVAKMKVKCTKAAMEGTLAGGKAGGTSHVKFEECVEPATAAKCTGLGDTTGIILALGEWKSVIDMQMPQGAALVFVVEPLHFTCGFALAELKGDVLCKDVEPTSSKATHEFKCEAKEGKAGEEESVYFGNGERFEIAPLLISVNHGAFEEATLHGKGTVTFKEAVEIMD